MYTYDAIGSYERVGYGCQGSGKELVQPVLDNQLKAASPLVLPPQVGEGRGRDSLGARLYTAVPCQRSPPAFPGGLCLPIAASAPLRGDLPSLPSSPPLPPLPLLPCSNG